jgi:hypothetical protein
VRRPRVVLYVVGALMLSASGLGACSERQGGSPQLAPIETSTTQALNGDLSTTTVDERPTKPVGSSPAQIRADFDQAVAARDFCGLLDVMNSALPDVEDRMAVVETYAKVAESMNAATEFVPEELAESWPVVVSASERASEAAERSQGDLNDPAISGAFDTGEFEQVSVELDTWEDEHCR